MYKMLQHLHCNKNIITAQQPKLILNKSHKTPKLCINNLMLLRILYLTKIQ